MRDYHGVSLATLTTSPEPSAAEVGRALQRIQRTTAEIDLFLRDLSRGIGRINLGEVPDGSGDLIIERGGAVVLEDYLFLPGRLGGQTVHTLDDSPGVTVEGTGTTLSNIGDIGNPIFRISDGSVSLADFRPYLFAAGVVELAVTDGDGAGIPINFPSDDGTSAFRIASTTNRTYLQCGLKNSGGGVDNANMTIGGAGASLATSLAYEFARIQFANSAGTANTTRVGINLRPDEYSGSAAANRAQSLHVKDFPGSAATDPAPLILEAHGDIGRRLIEIRAVSTGTTPNKQIGSPQIGLAGSLAGDSFNNSNGRLLLFSGGSLRATITSGGGTPGNSRITFRDQADALTFQFESASTWADSQTSSLLEPADRLMVTDRNGVALSRVGLSATSTVIGPRAPGSLPAPVSSRILTVVDSSANVAMHVDSNGVLHTTGGGRTNGIESVFLNADGNFIPFIYTDSSAPSHGLGANVAMIVSDFSSGGAFLLAADGPIGAADFVTVTVPVSGLGASTQNLITDISTNLLRNKFLKTGATLGIEETLGSSRASWSASLTADRTHTWMDFTGTIMLVGNDPPAVAAGALGYIHDTSDRTADLATTNLSNGALAGLYVVEVFLECTGNDAGAGTLNVVVGWTDAVGATTQTLAAEPGATALPLPLTSTGRTKARCLCKVASGEITIAVTNTGSYGTATYRLSARVIALG